MGNKGIEIVIADGDSTQIAKQIATYASKDEMRVVDMVSTGGINKALQAGYSDTGHLPFGNGWLGSDGAYE